MLTSSKSSKNPQAKISWILILPAVRHTEHGTKGSQNTVEESVNSWREREKEKREREGGRGREGEGGREREGGREGERGREGEGGREGERGREGGRHVVSTR